MNRIFPVCYSVRQSNFWQDLVSAMVESWKNLKTSKVFFVVYCVLETNRSALLRELLSNNSLFVGQLYKDKSLALHAPDLIYFATDLQTVNYYSTIHC